MLPEPYLQEDGITLYCADCRDIMPHLAHFDLLLTDPPYGIYLKGGKWGKKVGNGMDWDKQTSDDITISLARSICHKQIIWGGNYYQLPPSRCWLSWNKPERGLTMADAELAWTSFDSNIRVFDSSRNPDGKRLHPTQKPLDLMTWCLQQAGDVRTVLDPFAGSGTTLVAAKLRGLQATGIEQNPDYCAIIKERLSQRILIPA